MRISDWSSDVCSADLSNPTYKLLTPSRSYVLRRKPPGQLLKGAHAVEREAQVLIGLGKAGFPVAHVFGLCADDGVIGTAFYVMERSEEHTSELQSLMRISYAVFCLKKKKAE